MTVPESADELLQQLREAQAQQAEAAALLESCRAVLRSGEFRDAVPVIFNACKRLLGATAGYVGITPKGKTTSKTEFVDLGGATCSVNVEGSGIAIRGLREKAYRTGKAVYANDFCASPLANLLPAGHIPLENVLFAPLTVDGVAVGQLGLANKPGGFTAHDAEVATAFGELASMALQNSRNLQSLQESEERFRSVTQSANDGIATMDGAGRVVDWNAAMERMFGYAAAEVVGQPFVTVIPESLRPMYQQGLEELIAGRHPTILNKPLEAMGLRRDGREFPFEVSLAIWQTKENQFLTAIFRDITERKQSELELAQAKQAAEAANQAKSEFLANMSHEIRTPMTAILGFADLLASPGLSAEEHCEFLHIISRNGKALLDLLNDILDLSRIEAGELALALADVPLDQVIGDLLSIVRVRAEERGLALCVDYRRPLPASIRTDRARLRQILVNLVGNAIKFTEQGEVRLSISCDSQATGRPWLHLAVSDTGPGIPAETIGELFRPFMQADSSTTRQHGGSGLGLAISRRLARALGGDITVTSELGRGSTFTLSIDPGLPADSGTLWSPPTIEPAPAGIGAASEQSLSAAAGPFARVLLAEDVPDVQHVIRYVLEKMHLQVDMVENGHAACQQALASRAAARPYDLILMDIQMPQMDGYEATRRLRQAGWTGPIVALTAHAMSTDRQKCLDAGCNDYLTKPVTAAGLTDLLRRFAEKGETIVSATEPPSVAAAAAPAANAAAASVPAGLLDEGMFTDEQRLRLLRICAASMFERAGEIRRALAEHDAPALRDAIHALHGTAAVYGFKQIAACGRHLEESLRDGAALEQLQEGTLELLVLTEQAANQWSGTPIS